MRIALWIVGGIVGTAITAFTGTKLYKRRQARKLTAAV